MQEVRSSILLSSTIKIPSPSGGGIFAFPAHLWRRGRSAATCPAPLVGRGVRREKGSGGLWWTVTRAGHRCRARQARSDPAGPALPGSRAFALVSLACGLAVGTGQLIGFRLVQRVAAEVMIPQRSWFRVVLPRRLSLQ